MDLIKSSGDRPDGATVPQPSIQQVEKPFSYAKDIPDEKNPEDNWRHRSEGMKCHSCMWYIKKDGGANVGRCRRHAPTLGGYPVVFATDWCGDHKLK